MKITFIADSYGGPRIHNNIEEVTKEQSYPELIKKELEKRGYDIVIDYASYRKITELPPLLEKYQDSSIFIIQLGIVDCYPRPLSQKYTISKKFLPKLIRRIIRIRRGFFLKYIYNKPWSSMDQLYETIDTVCKIPNERFIWINVAPVNKFQEDESPGANDSIKKFNEMLAVVTKKYTNCEIIDIFSICNEIDNFECYFHATDSHLNVKGNKLYADELLKFFNRNPK